ncbi:MAG: FtsX-like permease family protein [Planctomycetes bacterium]|nr:FtsX-like permease family protein [Planctomycetota bacterium]NOG54605.1 FtsX-like permease family protein [Planctomycetota bacterium]
MISILLWPLTLLRFGYQGIGLALGQIWTNKMRSFLTTLGIIIGVGSVTAVIAGLQGMRTKVLDSFESFGTNKMYFIHDWPDDGPKQHASWRVIRLRPDHFNDMLEHCPSIASLTRIREFGARMEHADKAMNVSVTGIEPDWHDIENRSVILGRTFTHTDNEGARQVCLITEQTRDQLRLDRDCTGQSILINDRRYYVVGVLEERPDSMFRDGSSEAQVFIPFRTAWKVSEGFMYAMAACESPEVADDARAEARFFLRHTRNLAPDEPDTFRIEIMKQYLDQFNAMAVGITFVAGGIVTISLLVGGIGIMNIMLVSVSERTREIGLRKAVGAKPSAILLQFLIEAVTLCLIGGLVGLLGGQAITELLASIEKAGLEEAYIPAWAMGMAFGFSATVGIVFGMFPAIKASRLDPIQALRHE